MSDKCKASVFQIHPIDGSAKVNVGASDWHETYPDVRAPLITVEIPVHISSQPTDEFLQELKEVALQAVNWDVVDQWTAKMQALASEKGKQSSD